MTEGPGVAFLIMAHDRPAHLRRLLAALDHPRAHVFLHIDAKSAMPPPDLSGHSQVRLCADRFPIHWGGFSMVRATLALLRQAAGAASWSHCALLSGSDFPIRPIEEVLAYFDAARDVSFINAEPMPQSYAPLSRLVYRRPIPGDGWLRRAWLWSARTAAWPPARRDPIAGLGGRRPYSGQQWWALSRDLAEAAVGAAEAEPGMLAFFERTHIPDECFFQTIVKNDAPDAELRPSLTWASWTQGARHPDTLSVAHLPELRRLQASGEALFVRKFADDSGALVEALASDWAASAADQL